jgi:O-antigen ligase
MERSQSVTSTKPASQNAEALSGAFFWLSVFYFVYCARPEDWLPGLKFVPMAKISGLFALLGLMASIGKTKRHFRDLPKESFYLLTMIGLLFVSALSSEVWKGGAFFHTLDFSKVYIAFVLTFLLITTVARLQRIIFIQAASVAVIAIVSIAKGHSQPRLEGVLGGIYSNPNDLAFAMVLSMPFCLALLLSTKNLVHKAAWLVGILMMAVALFMTASRAGFIDLIIAGSVCLWHFGVRGKRPMLILTAAVFGTLLLLVAGGRLKDRFFAISGDINSIQEQKAYGSFEERRALMIIALHGIEHDPLLGVGLHNFANYSGRWKEVHASYLQIAVEGGIPVLILYLMFFQRGFANLKRMRKARNLDKETTLLVGALHSSLVGFIVGACFAPEAYQFFPYFAIAYTSVLVAILKEQEDEKVPVPNLLLRSRHQAEVYAGKRITGPVSFVR